MSTRPNSGELSRLLAAKMSCRRRHADVMNVGWLVSATGAIFAGRGSGIDGGIHAGENGQDDAFSWIDCLGRWYRHGRRLACRRAAQISATVLRHGVLLRHSGGVPEQPAGQCGLLDAMRPARI